MITEDVFFSAFFVLFVFTAIAWITFAQFTMKPNEKKMMLGALPNNFAWNGVGA